MSIVNCCAAREDGANVAAPAFREAFAAMVNEYAVADYQDSQNQSLEAFIAFFDTWYPYGYLNAETIHIGGDGTWAYCNTRNEDGTVGYLYDGGSFLTSGTTDPADGSRVAVSLNKDGYLMLTPVSERFECVYADAAFIRESESIAYEAQPIRE